MNRALGLIRISVNWGGRALSVLLALSMVAALLLPLALAAPGVARAQPRLLHMAAAQPDQTVAVIVQKAAQDGRVEEMVTGLGGTVTKDLHIINAFAAEMSAAAAAQLAQSSSVRWVSLDAPVEGVGKPAPRPSTPPSNTYLDTLGVRSVWNMGRQGQGIGVAVIDSGISPDIDFTSIRRSVSFSPNSSTTNDVYGHGTHVAGIIAGNGSDSAGQYMGIAPQADLISLKVSDESGMAYESDTVAAMQWVLDNKAAYNIRVVNLSINSTVEQSYHTSPMDAAAEILWFNGVVVVASAGNYWSDLDFNPVRAAPANDPFIITVGATDEKGSTRTRDDVIANFSAFGNTPDGFFKPDIYAPGTSIYSVLSKSSPWCAQYPDRVVLSCEYFRLSGTSMAAPMVTGAVVLLLQDEPNLTPDQVKYRLINTADWIGPGKYLNVYAAVTGNTTQSSNTGLQASQLLWTGSEPITWNSVNWNSVNWNSVNWNSVNWNSVNWNSVNWNSTFWGP